MIKTKETNKNENNIVEEYSKEYVLEKIKEYLNESPEYYDKSYFFSKKIKEINTLLKMYGTDNFETILKKIELDWFFKTYRDKKHLKDYYMKNYAKTQFDYENYHFMITEVNNMIIDQYKKGKSLSLAQNFNIANILWLIKTSDGKIEIDCPKEDTDEEIFRKVMKTLGNIRVHYILEFIDVEYFKQYMLDCAYYRVITDEDICKGIYKSFIKEQTKNWICN